MRLPKDYDSVMARSNEIQKKALGMDFDKYESGSVAFDYEGLMKDTGYTIQECIEIEAETAVGNTPLIELRNITKLSRKYAAPGMGARIFVKDEMCNASGSFKARRAALAVHHAKKLGYEGRYGGNFRKLRCSSCISGCDAGNEMYCRSGVL